MNLSPKVIVLDFDGVIIESNEIKHNAFKKIFQGYPSQFDEIMRYHFDNPALDRHQKFDHVANNILKLKDSLELRANWVNQFVQITREAILNCPMVIGAEEFLESFVSTIPLYLASATPEAELNLILERRNLKTFFKRVFGAPIKKSEVLKQICEIEGVQSHEMLFIGDTPADGIAAERVGVPFIGRISDQPLPFQFVFNDLNEIRNYLIKGESL